VLLRALRILGEHRECGAQHDARQANTAGLSPHLPPQPRNEKFCLRGKACLVASIVLCFLSVAFTPLMRHAHDDDDDACFRGSEMPADIFIVLGGLA